MATSSIRVDDFEDGALPRICAASGAVADRPYRMRAVHRPSWPVIFILLGPVGWLIMLVVAAGTERHVDGSLPLADSAHAASRAARRRSSVRLVEVTAATAGFVALFAWIEQPIALVGALAIGAASAGALAVSASRPRGSVGIKLSANGRQVLLRDVSEEFAAAYRDQERRRLADRQNDRADLDR